MPETFEEGEDPIGEFREEIMRLHDIEVEKKRAWEARGMKDESFDPDLYEVDATYLTNIERFVYMERDRMPQPEFEEISAIARKKYSIRFQGKYDSPEYQSLKNFWAWIRNYISSRFQNEQLRQIRETK